MKPIHFDPEKDLSPMPFDGRICRRALQMKNTGLEWKPHVGCFVWDPEHYIKHDSPFPHRIYFVLSIPRFIDIFGNIEKMIEKLVWLPTWHQTRLLGNNLGIPGDIVVNLLQENDNLSAGEELFHMYGIIMNALIEINFSAHIGRSGDIDKICIADLIGRLGDITAWPDNFTVEVLRVYHQFIEGYLNVLRQKENKPMDWFPRTLSIDPELADGMRHFYSDYQHITRKFFQLNQKLDRLREVENDNRSRLHQDRIEEIFKLCAE